MTKYRVRVTRGKRASSRVTPNGNRYVFFFNEGTGGKWLRLDTGIGDEETQRRCRLDVEYFKKDDLFEVREGFVDNVPVKPKPIEVVPEPEAYIPKINKRLKRGDR